CVYTFRAQTHGVRDFLHESKFYYDADRYENVRAKVFFREMPELPYICIVSARRALLAIVSASALLLPTRLDAQLLRGQVLLPDSSTRVSGVIVVATDAYGAVTRTLSGLDGDFLLRLPHAGQFFVQALRIGYRPTVFPPVT